MRRGESLEKRRVKKTSSPPSDTHTHNTFLMTQNFKSSLTQRSRTNIFGSSPAMSWISRVFLYGWRLFRVHIVWWSHWLALILPRSGKIEEQQPWAPWESPKMGSIEQLWDNYGNLNNGASSKFFNKIEIPQFEFCNFWSNGPTLIFQKLSAVFP